MSQAYRIRLHLKKSDPEISRTLLVPGDYSIYELHLCMQVSLGWNDLAAFELVTDNLTVGVEPSYSGAGLQHGTHQYRHADDFSVGEVFGEGQRLATYTYDFDRLWEFEVAVSQEQDMQLDLPTCIESYEAAPIEEADDLDTFYGMLIAFADPQQALHEYAKSLLGEDFDVYGPQAEDITQALANLFGDGVEPHGVEEEEDLYGWWDPSKYDDNMRLRVKQEEISQRLPRDLAQLDVKDKHAELLKALRR